MNDLKFAFRQLRKNTGCTAVAALTPAFKSAQPHAREGVAEL